MAVSWVSRGNPNPASQTLLVFDSSGDYKNEPSERKKISSIMNQLEIYIDDRDSQDILLASGILGKKTGFEKNEPTSFLCLMGKPSWFNRPPEIVMKKKKERERRFIKRTLNRMNKDVRKRVFPIDQILW